MALGYAPISSATIATANHDVQRILQRSNSNDSNNVHFFLGGFFFLVEIEKSRKRENADLNPIEKYFKRFRCFRPLVAFTQNDSMK